MSDTTGDGAATAGDCSSESRTPDARDGEPTTDRETTTDRSPSRRRLLTAGGGAVATLLAGCSGLLPGREDPNIEGDSFVDDGANDSNGTAATDSPTQTQVHTETHVVGIDPFEVENGRRFVVSLNPPDEEGGADWWQLETFAGERIVQHTFDEPRTGSTFTSERTLDPEATKLVVRGHDVEAGYGGQAILLDLESESFAAEYQGAEPRSFEGYEF